MASIVTSLNADAAEFHPNKIKPHNHFFTNKLLPKHQPHHHLFYTTCPPPPTLVFYPTTNKHPFYSPFRFHPTTHQLRISEPKPSFFHSPNSIEKNDLKAVESSRSSSKVIDDRSTGRYRFPRLEWRKKGETKGQRKTHVNREQYYFRAVHHKKNRRGRFPLVPVRPDGEETSVMIKNIPSKYNRDLLVNFLEDHCMVENAKENENGEESTFAFDFVYLPIDFRTGFNKGYAFVNFTKAKAAWKFVLTASNQKWELFLSHKIREVVAARLQGKEKLVHHFESMSFPCASDEVLPLCFSPPRDGITKGNQWTIGRLLY